MTDAPLHLLIAHKTKADTSILCDRGVRYFCALIGSCSAFLGVVNGVLLLALRGQNKVVIIATDSAYDL